MIVNSFLIAKLIAAFHHLMRSADEIEIVLVQEEINKILAIIVADSSFEAIAPSVSCWFVSN